MTSTASERSLCWLSVELMECSNWGMSSCTIKPASVMSLVFVVQRVGQRIQVGVLARIEVEDAAIFAGDRGCHRGHERVGDALALESARSTAMSCSDGVGPLVGDRAGQFEHIRLAARVHVAHVDTRQHPHGAVHLSYCA